MKENLLLTRNKNKWKFSSVQILNLTQSVELFWLH